MSNTPSGNTPSGHECQDLPEPVRREFFSSVGRGLCGMALAALTAPRTVSSAPSRRQPESGTELSPRPAHFSARADAVIQLFMNGGPSQMDLFDPKPELTRHHGTPYFDKIAGEVENP